MTCDVNLMSFNGPMQNGQHTAFTEPIDGTGFADTLKFSTGLKNFVGEFGTVVSGYEDVVDVNNLCDGVELRAARWVLKDCTMGFTVKGGSQNVRLAGEVEGHGRECDIDLGNASDQSHEKTTGVRLALWRDDGSPLRVRVLNADMPEEEVGSGPYIYVFPWKAKWLRVVTVKVFMEWRRIMRRFK